MRDIVNMPTPEELKAILAEAAAEDEEDETRDELIDRALALLDVLYTNLRHCGGGEPGHYEIVGIVQEYLLKAKTDYID